MELGGKETNTKTVVTYHVNITTVLVCCTHTYMKLHEKVCNFQSIATLHKTLQEGKSVK